MTEYFFFDYYAKQLGGSVLGQKKNIGTEKNVLVSLYPIEELAPDQFAKQLSLSSTPTAALSGICYVNLDIKIPFRIPLASTLKFAQFYNSNATAQWDELDLPKLENKTANESLALGLKGKVVLIGDKADTFEMFGVRLPGPFVFRNKDRATQIIPKDENGKIIYQVTDMLLQLLESGSLTQSSGNRIVYTPSTPIAPQINDLVIVDGTGNIMLPDRPIDGFRFTLDDRKLRRLDTGRNWVVPASGARIGLGQATTPIDHLTPLKWGPEDKGSFSSYIYESASNNWVVLLTREISGATISQVPRLSIVTGVADITAQPYDSFYLGGNTSIYIHHLVTERQFIDVEWEAGADWIAKVVCPVGDTMATEFEDLTIRTLLTSVTRLRITLGANNNFQIS